MITGEWSRNIRSCNCKRYEKHIEDLREVVDKLLISHFNLYKSTFGEFANPNDDIIRKEAVKTLKGLYK